MSDNIRLQDCLRQVLERQKFRRNWMQLSIQLSARLHRGSPNWSERRKMQPVNKTGRVRTLKRKSALKKSHKGYLTGFYRAVRENLKATAQGRPPTPQSVYKVLRDERPSRMLLENIFENCPELLAHPATSDDVKKIYTEYLSNGHHLPDRYGKGGTIRAADCL